MNGTRWYSKQDVLNDLAAMTGVPVPVDDFDENFYVQGEKPPPKRACSDEDNEFELRYGKMNGVPADSVTPDLNGITQMLRMVNDVTVKDEEEEPTESVVHVISKLNPNIQEFVPKSNLTSDKMSDKTNSDKTSENTNKSDFNSDDKLRKEAELTEKIREKSKGNTVKDKTEKNVAIAALLKLNSVRSPPVTPNISSGTPTISCSSSPKPMVLYTPEYFEHPPATSKEPSTETSPKTSTNKYSNDPNVQESIKKVNNWFEKPVTTTDFVKESLKPKPEIEETAKKLMSNPILEPVTYRKKEKSSTSSKSTESHITTDVENATSTAQPTEKPKTPSKYNTYRPSPLAAELLVKYKANAKKMETFDEEVLDKVITVKGKKGQKSVLTFGLNFRGI